MTALPHCGNRGDYYASVCPFTDVPQWAKSSIGFLYDNKLAAGQSSTTFGTDDVSKRDYAVMMLRVLNIEHSYQDCFSYCGYSRYFNRGAGIGQYCCHPRRYCRYDLRHIAADGRTAKADSAGSICTGASCTGASCLRNTGAIILYTKNACR